MTHDTADSVPTFDKTNMAKFYDATALFFKRQPSPPEVVNRCGIPGLEVSESTWAEWEAAVEANAR